MDLDYIFFRWPTWRGLSKHLWWICGTWKNHIHVFDGLWNQIEGVIISLKVTIGGVGAFLALFLVGHGN